MTFSARLVKRLKSIATHIALLRASLARIALAERLPRILFIAALAGAIFSYGVIVGRYQLFPYDHIKAAEHTATAFKQRWTGADITEFALPTNVPLPHMLESRIRPLVNDNAGGNFILTGGWYQYREFCPQFGCLAVELGRTGKLVHAIPLRPDEFERNILADYPHETWRFGRHFVRGDEIFGLSQLPDGGIIATFINVNDFPTGQGVARVDRDGRVLWYRHTYAMHWAYAGNNRIWATTGTLATRDITVPISPRDNVSLHCDGKYLNEGIRVVDYDGHPHEYFSVLDAILASPYASILVQNNINGDQPVCDPLHLNFVTPVGAGLAARLPGVTADDYLISMRNVSAFAIIGAHDHKVKYLYTGSFRQQHSVQPYKDSQVLIFDNNGVNAVGFPSRVVAYNVITGDERIIFDTRSVPGDWFHPLFEGVLDLSRDKKYLLVTSPRIGRAYELRLSDGKIITKIENLQDLRDLGFSRPLERTHAYLRPSHGVYFAE